MAKFSTRIKKLADLAESLENALNTLLEDMESYYDSKSEKWQEGEKGIAFSDAKDSVQAASENAHTAFDELSGIPDDI